jgi:hypothetical protein
VSGFSVILLALDQGNGFRLFDKFGAAFAHIGDHQIEFFVGQSFRSVLDCKFFRHSRGDDLQIRRRLFQAHNFYHPGAVLGEVLAQRLEEIAAELVTRALFPAGSQVTKVKYPDFTLADDLVSQRAAGTQ